MAKKRGETEALYLESLAGTLTGWSDPERRLQKAFENDEFLLFGQSIEPLDSARKIPFHLEILIRLREEERNLTPPGAFLPILEHFDMMPALDRWVIRHAALWWKARQGIPNTVLNFNLSPETLDSAEFPGFVAVRLCECGLPPTAVCFEVIGSDVAGGSADALESVEKLKALGCQFAVTAFGRDSISFDALKTLGATVVKIDGGMIREIHSDAVAFAKVRSIQRVCSKGNVKTMAEFVEQPETLSKLREINIDYVQGYGVARPEPLTGTA
jgi:EAL domain-containing protein (putative c-di-GMP-specific phosphodiesterase class I)